MSTDVLITAKKVRCLEAIFEIVFRLVGISLVYYLLNKILIFLGLLGSASELMVSLLILPVLYILKDAYKIIEPFTVKVWMTHEDITVSRGLVTKIEDTLEFKTVENLEVIESLLGKVFGYATIKLYSPGGGVEIPFVYDSSVVLSDLKNKRKKLANPPAKS